MKPTVLLVEPLVDRAAQVALEARANLVVSKDHTEQSICEAVRDADGLIVRGKGRITPAVMDAAPRLRVIGKHGVGVDNIDVASATARGIQVVNTPMANARSTAEHAMGLLQAANRQLVPANALVVQGKDWRLADRFVGRELRGRILGLVGAGHVAVEVARIASRGFEMALRYWDYRNRPWPSTDSAADSSTLEKLFSEADFLSIHVPGGHGTEGLVSAPLLERMNSDAILVNTSRGSVVDESALLKVLEEGRIRGAALDVLIDEPEPKSALMLLPNVLVTPHIGAYTAEAFASMARVADDVLGVIAGRKPMHPVV